MTTDDEARMANHRESRLTPPSSPKRSQQGSSYDAPRGTSTGRSSPPPNATGTASAATAAAATTKGKGPGTDSSKGDGGAGGDNASHAPKYGTSSTGDEFLGIYHPSETVPTKSVVLPRSKTVITFRAPPPPPTAPILPPEARAAAWVLKGDALCRGQHCALVEAACRGSEASLAVARMRKTLMLNHPSTSESVTALRQLRAAIGAYSCAVAVIEKAAEGTAEGASDDESKSLSAQPDLLLKRAEALEVLACAAEALPEAAAEAKSAADNDHAVALRNSSAGAARAGTSSAGAGKGAGNVADTAAASEEEEAEGAAGPQDSGHCLALALADVNAALTLDPSGTHPPLGVGAAWLQRSRVLRHLSHRWGDASSSSSSSSSPSRARNSRTARNGSSSSSDSAGGMVVDVSLLEEAVESARHAHSLSVSAFAGGLDPVKTAAGGQSDHAIPEGGANNLDQESMSAAAAVSVGRAVTDLKRELKLAKEAQQNAARSIVDNVNSNNRNSHALQHHNYHQNSGRGSAVAGPPYEPLVTTTVHHVSSSPDALEDEFRLLESGSKRSRRAPAAAPDFEAPSSSSPSFFAGVGERPTANQSSSNSGVFGDSWPSSHAAPAPVFSAPQSELSTSDASTLSHAMEMMAKTHADKVAEMERNHAEEVSCARVIVCVRKAIREPCSLNLFGLNSGPSFPFRCFFFSGAPLAENHAFSSRPRQRCCRNAQSNSRVDASAVATSSRW